MLINFSNLKSALLSSLCCSTVCFGLLALQTAVSNPLMGQDALKALDEMGLGNDQEVTPAAQTAEQQQQDALKKKVGAMIFQELDSLVPGEQVEGSPAAEALQSAVDAYTSKNAKMSMTILEQAAAANPSYPPAELLMAGMCFAGKDLAAGTQFLQKAAMEKPNHPGIYAAYGRLASASNRNVDAKVHYEKLLILLDQIKDPITIAHYENEYLEGMSQVAMRLEDYEMARNLSGQLLKRDPKKTNPLQVLARISFNENKLDESVQHLTKLRSAKPETRTPEAVIGTWYSRAGNQAKASEWLSKLPTLYPNDASAQLDYASWSLGREDIDGAVAAIAKAEAIEPASATSKAMKGKIMFYQRKFDDAVATFKSLYEENPRNLDNANMYVLSMIESSSSENKIRANQLANLNVQSSPKNRVILATLGYVRLQTLGVNDQLKVIFQQVAQTRNIQSPEVDYFLANFLKDLGQNQAALRLLQQASKHEGLFLYRKQAEQMRQVLAISATPATP